MIFTLFLILSLLSQTGCKASTDDSASVAEEYFQSPNVVSICHAIEANDQKKIKQLVDSGVDVNARGHGNVTPLLWAYVQKNLDAFELLLKQGADPNIAFDDGLGLVTQFEKNDSVTHVACRTFQPDYFDLVFENGGAVNLRGGKLLDSPLVAVIKSRLTKQERTRRVQKLIQLGADLDQRNATGATPAMDAVTYFQQFDIALMLLSAGADPTLFNRHVKLAHRVAGQELKSASAAHLRQYNALVAWLESHGQSIDEATHDLERWAEWSDNYLPEKVNSLIEQEIAERKAAEAKGKTPSDQPE